MDVSLPLRAETAAADDVPDVALIRAAQRDPTLFASLYERYLPRIYGYVRLRIPRAEDAADLTHQVFAQALGALPRYREQGPPFSAWLFRIARNLVADHHRWRHDDVCWDLDPRAAALQAREEGVEATVLRREAAARLRELLIRLDPHKRELVVLRFVSGLKISEIAQIVGRSEPAVKGELRRVLRALREEYDDDE